MSGRRRVVAVKDFWSFNENLRRLAATDPNALYPARIEVGTPFVAKDTRMWSDHPIVLAQPTLFVDDDTVPPPSPQPVLEEATESAAEERARDERIAEAVARAVSRHVVPGRGKRGGPPPGDGLTIATIRQALDGWTGEWPPPQPTFAEFALGGISDRRVRQVLDDESTSWRGEIRAAESRRK